MNNSNVVKVTKVDGSGQITVLGTDGVEKTVVAGGYRDIGLSDYGIVVSGILL